MVEAQEEVLKRREKAAPALKCREPKGRWTWWSGENQAGLKDSRSKTWLDPRTASERREQGRCAGQPGGL